MVGKNKLAVAIAGLAVMTVGMFAVILGELLLQKSSVLLHLAILLVNSLLLAWAAKCLLANRQRLQQITAFAERLGAGDLTVATGIADDEDDLAEVGASLDLAMGQVRGRVGAICRDSAQLAGECATLAARAPQLAGLAAGFNQGWQAAMANTERLQANTSTIYTQVDAFNRQMQTVSVVTQDTSQLLGTIIGSTEEMSVTIADIAANAERARTVAGTAVANVNAASNRVDELGAAALEISKVTDVIVEIAEQTKLLALNATIEAARAGEAGKGFAVVANEVKELALQTNNAIAEIRNKVEAMQQSTDNTITEIGAINQTIKAVNEIVVSIAGAVEEQAVTTKDIVAKLGQGESGIRRIGETLAATAADAHEITGKSSAVAAAAETLVQEMAAVQGQGVDLAQTIDATAAQTAGLVQSGDRVLAEAETLRT